MKDRTFARPLVRSLAAAQGCTGPALPRLAVFLAVGGLCLAAACAPQPSRTGSDAGEPPQKSITVSAAMTLREPFERLAAEFERERGVRVTLNLGASGVLQKQIEGGAAADVFASASPKQIDALIARGLVSAEATAPFASNRVVVLMRSGEARAVKSAKDLARFERVATGDPASTPIGQAASEWLEGQGAAKALEGRLVYGENVVQVLEYLLRGEVDAAIVFASEATGRDDVEVVHMVPPSEISPIRYVIAPLASSANASEAAAFVDLVLSERGRRALADAGFVILDQDR